MKFSLGNRQIGSHPAGSRRKPEDIAKTSGGIQVAPSSGSMLVVRRGTTAVDSLQTGPFF